MAYHSAYRPPPPAPSAFFALHLASSSSSAAPLAPIADSTPNSSSTASSLFFLSRTQLDGEHAWVTSYPLQVQQHIDLKAAALASGKPAPSRNNSASSITALPSLSSSLNNLVTATSIDHLDVCGTHTAEADELLRRVIQGNVKRLSNPSMGPQPIPINSSTLARTGSSSTNLHYQPSHHHQIQPERTFPRYSDDSDEDDDGSDDGSDGDGDHSSLGGGGSRQSHPVSLLAPPHHLQHPSDRSQSDMAYQPRSVSSADLKAAGRSSAPLPRSASSGGLVMN
ncbi:hypothetical protein FRC17_002460, partial [Serendipita sp. 399]